MTEASIVVAPSDTSRQNDRTSIVAGQWYWVTEVATWDGQWNGKKKGDTIRWLGCVMSIGSNYVELSPPQKEGYGLIRHRVHFDRFWKELEFEPNADAYIRQRIDGAKNRLNELMGEVQEVTARLGIIPTQTIADTSQPGQNALAVISTQVDATAYKNALILAKDTTLPALFKQIEETSKTLARWMAAPTLPMRAQIAPMKDNIGTIEDRIDTIGLYAGLTEDAVQCCEGAPAAIGEKLRVMQRRLYMDEECLLSYEGGGIELRNIDAFDAWIARPENRDRLLPFPRTLAAFRVRRDTKEREDGGDMWRAFVNAQIAQSDKKTFLYVRNGAQVWRVDCDFVFEEMIFPDSGDFAPNEPMMIKMFGERVDKIMSRREWEVRHAEVEERGLKYKAWKEENPGESWINNPFHNSVGFHNEFDEYRPFDPTNVYYDDALKVVQDQIKKYNRIATIIQGLFDRSLVLHPHVPVQTWTQHGFEAAIELIYDAHTLTHGSKPDFEAYRMRLNLKIDADSIVTGQYDYWTRQEAIKENARQERDWRNRDRSRSNYRRYIPYGNPGPVVVGKPDDWKARSRKAVFRWKRERQSWRAFETGDLPTSLTVPDTELLNVSAYKPGDFKQFFSDPRSRAEYLKWAPLMLAAEDYHAGKKTPAQTGDERE